MAKVCKQNKARQRKLSCFAKDLVRRSKAKCEMCQVSKMKLVVYEVPPYDKDLDLEKCVFICAECLDQIEKPARMDVYKWQCLNTSLWSDISAVKVLSFRMLKRLESEQGWASDLMHQIELDQELQAWADGAG